MSTLKKTGFVAFALAAAVAASGTSTAWAARDMLATMLTTVPAPAIVTGNGSEETAGAASAGDDRAPHLYAERLPGTLGCIDDAHSRVTWGCD